MTTTGSSAPPTADDRPIIDPRIRDRLIAVRRNRGRQRLRWVIALFGFFALVAVVLCLLHTPLFSARAVKVSGMHARDVDRPNP